MVEKENISNGSKIGPWVVHDPWLQFWSLVAWTAMMSQAARPSSISLQCTLFFAEVVGMVTLLGVAMEGRSQVF